MRMYQVDAFTDKPFGGNPAAVCLLQSSDLPLSDEIRQNIAAEMNLSETAFLESLDDTNSDTFSTCHSSFRLRWFTPTIEVPLCGHATLAAAAALVLGEGNQSPILSFHTLSGTLTVQYNNNDSNSHIPSSSPPLFKMSLPAIKPTSNNLPHGTGPGSDLIKALLHSTSIEVEDILYATSVKYLLVVIKSTGQPTSSVVANIQPDGEKLKQAYKGNDLIGIIVTEKCDNNIKGVDFVSRFFAPWAGILEDPVTGSAHSPLAMYWSSILGKNTLLAHQVSKRRGELYLKVVPPSSSAESSGSEEENEGRVEVSGHAIITVKGELFI